MTKNNDCNNTTINGNSIDLGTIIDGSYKSYTTAYNCHKCNKIIIDYGEK